MSGISKLVIKKNWIELFFKIFSDKHDNGFLWCDNNCALDKQYTFYFLFIYLGQPFFFSKKMCAVLICPRVKTRALWLCSSTIIRNLTPISYRSLLLANCRSWVFNFFDTLYAYAFIDTYPISTSTKTTALNVTIQVNDSIILSLWKRFNSAACVYIPFKATMMMPDKTHCKDKVCLLFGFYQKSKKW